MSYVTVLKDPIRLYGDDAWSQSFTLTEGGAPVSFSAHGAWFCQVVGSRGGVDHRVNAQVTTGSSGLLTVSLSTSQMKDFHPSLLDVRSKSASGALRSWLRVPISWVPAVTDPDWK